MKVLHILNELKHSGAEVMLNTAYETFAEYGIESHVLSSGDEIGEYGDVLARSGYKLHHIPFRKSVMFFLDVYALLRREKFTAVHVHTERAFIWYTLVARLARVPTIVRTFHNVFMFTSWLQWKRKLQRKLSSNILKSVHTAIGESVLHFEKEKFGNDCVLVRNWIDVEQFRPPREQERDRARRLYELDARDFVVATVGSCDARKNHIALFSAVAKVNELSGNRTRIVHVGAGPMLPEEESYLRRRAMEPYCRLVGVVNDVRPCLYAADAFVMTSLWEGLGNAALEAMSTGLPVILYDVHGLRELLQDGRGGILVEPREDALVEALLIIERNRRLGRAKGRDARQKVLETYSLEGSVRRLTELYAIGFRCDGEHAAIPQS
jgi:glycosyltransferase involved in cell wall biosynthesis